MKGPVKILTVQIPYDDYEAAKALAEKALITMTQYVGDAVREKNQAEK